MGMAIVLAMRHVDARRHYPVPEPVAGVGIVIAVLTRTSDG